MGLPQIFVMVKKREDTSSKFKKTRGEKRKKVAIGINHVTRLRARIFGCKEPRNNEDSNVAGGKNWDEKKGKSGGSIKVGKKSVESSTP